MKRDKTVIERKWEWIAKRLEELGYKKLAEEAKEIDRVLLELYGDRHTEAWKFGYMATTSWFDAKAGDTKMQLVIILGVAHNTSFCIACHEDICASCKFAKKAGFCMTKDSKFYNFVSELVALIESRD